MSRIIGGIRADSTSVSLPAILRSTTDNTELTGKIAANLTAYYWRQGGAPTVVTLSDLALITTAWASGGVKEADATHQPGAYRIDWPDAAFASGADWVVLSVKVAGGYLWFERYGLDATYANLDRVGTGVINTTSVIGAGNAVETSRGCDYSAADGYAIDWTDTGGVWPTLTSATIQIWIDDALLCAGSVVTPTGSNKKVRAEPNATQTMTLTPGFHEYEVQATLTGGHIISLVRGRWTSRA